MGVLLAIWKRFKNLIVFLLLELLAVGFILSFNAYQNSHFFQAITSVRGNFSRSFTLFYDYLNLYSENKNLLAENAKLVTLLKNIQESSEIEDLPNSRHYDYIPAKIAYSSVNIPDNYLIINKGEKQGVKPEMAAVSSRGLVGIVYAVTEDYASILPIINTTFSCLISVKNTTLSANTSWSGKNFKYINVKGVPLHINVQKGDSIFTNKNSALYPDKELIGMVEAIKKEDLGKSFALKVKLATDFAKLQNVYVIKNKDKQQIDSLLNYE